CRVDALAIHEKLTLAPDDDVNLVVLPMSVQERYSVAGRNYVQRHFQARRPQQAPQEQFAPRWLRDFGRLQLILRPSLQRTSVEAGEVSSPHRLVVQHRLTPFRTNLTHEGKHFPKAISNFGDPLMRIFLRSSAHSRLRSFARKPSQFSLSAVTRRSASPR